MAKNNYFQFKQFKIIQEKTAMKVSTDGVLLGAWANVSKANNVLDIGTGTGLVALMLAQRSLAQITGIEIENEAANEAKFNVQNSPWANRIQILNLPFQHFYKSAQIKYDLIISNPPFFENSLKSNQLKRSFARHNIALTYSELIFGSEKLLTTEGRITCILPYDALSRVLSEAYFAKLFPVRICKVKSAPQKPAIRILLELGKFKTVPKQDSLNIYDESGKKYSEEYKNLTCDYYLEG